MQTILTVESWYCPFCAALLTKEPGYLFCAQGNCGFSIWATDEFLAGRTNAQQPATFASGRSMRWFCPACAHGLVWGKVNERAVFGCAHCGFFMPAGMQTVLLHYHDHA